MVTLASKWISGFCTSKHCEGTQPVNHKGTPLKVCVAIGDGPGAKNRCGCKCHKDIDKMYESAGLPRVAQQSPLWKPAPSPDLSWLYEDRKSELDAFVPDRSQGTPAHVEPARDHGIPVEQPRHDDAERTPSGYRRKGQLEDSVQEVCTGYLKGEYESDGNGDMTTKHIAALIDAENPPSPGAVQAVLERWEKLGYAEMRRKPVGFQMLTVEGMEKGLRRMQQEAAAKRKVERKRSRATSNRFRG